MDVGIADEDHVPRQLEQAHRGEAVGTLRQPNHLLDVAQMISIGPERAAQEPVRLVPAEQHRPYQGAVAPHLGCGDVSGQAMPLALLIIGLCSIGDSVLIVEAGNLDVAAGLKAKAQRCDFLGDHVRPAHQDRRCKALVDCDLRSPKDAVVLALRVHDALAA